MRELGGLGAPVIRMDPLGYRAETLDYLDRTINSAVIEAKGPRWRAGAIADGERVVSRKAAELVASARESNLPG